MDLTTEGDSLGSGFIHLSECILSERIHVHQ